MENVNEWVECLLDDLLVRMSNGCSEKQYNEKVGYPISRIETIWNEKIDLNRVKYVKGDNVKLFEKYVLKYNDILFSHINSGVHLGKTAIFKQPNSNLIHGINLLLLRPSKVINADFLLYQLRYIKYRGDFVKVAQHAVNQSSINQRKLKKFNLRLPPIPIQRAIVTKLESLLSNLEQGIASLQKAQAQLKVYRQAVLKKAFEGELTKEWRTQQTNLPTAETLLQQIQTERRKHHELQMANWEKAVQEWQKNGKEGRKPSKPKKLKEIPPIGGEELKELGELPDGWKWFRFKNIVKDMCLGKMLDKTKNTGEYQPYLANINVRWGKFNLTDLPLMRFESFESDRYSVKREDLIICEGGEPGRCAIWKIDRDVKIQKALHRVRFFPNTVANWYIYYFIVFSSKTNHLTKYFTGTTIKHLTGKGLSKVEIPIGSFQEQNQIVQEIESRLSVCDKLEETIVANLQKAKSLRQSILKQAFEGKLLTEAELAACRAEADYEPASKLLERIQAEKAKQVLEAKAKKVKRKRKV